MREPVAAAAMRRAIPYSLRMIRHTHGTMTKTRLMATHMIPLNFLSSCARMKRPKMLRENGETNERGGHRATSQAPAPWSLFVCCRQQTSHTPMSARIGLQRLRVYFFYCSSDTKIHTHLVTGNGLHRIPSSSRTT